MFRYYFQKLSISCFTFSTIKTVAVLLMDGKTISLIKVSAKFLSFPSGD